MTFQPRATDALLVIDVQRDFLPPTPDCQSTLAVIDGNAILPGLNAVAKNFEHVVLTQDWHPRGHISFASAHPGKRPFVDTVETPCGAQSLWPDHCVQGTAGAEIDPRLHIPHAELILRKGFRCNIDSYSAFLENDHTTPTGLAGYLRERNLKRLFLAGLAYDFCVGFSAIDGTKLGFECVVVEDLTRAVSLPATAEHPGSIEQTNARFAASGIRRIHADDLSSS